MTDAEFLESKGWEHWYTDENWWVHPKTVADPTRQDFTNYQFPTADALAFEANPKPIPYAGDLGAALKYIVESQRKAAQVIFLVIFSLFFGVTASAQCVATPEDPCISVNQSLIDRSAKAAAELIEARKTITSFLAERASADAERQAAARVIARLEAIVAAQDELTATHKQMIEMWKDLNAEKDRLIDRYEKRLNAGKTPWQKFLDAVKTVLTIGVGIGIGRSL